MSMNIFNENIDAAMIDRAAAAGLPKHNQKQVVAQARQDGYLWQTLEDGTEIMRNPDGEFIEEWPL